MLRTGYIAQSKEKRNRNHITLGAGFVYDRFLFDFEYRTPIQNEVSIKPDNVMKFSLSIDLGSKVKTKSPDLAVTAGIF